jgi:hypothetical protein
MPSLRVSFPAHRVVIQLTRNLVPFTFYHLNPAFQFSLTSTICNPDDIAKTIHGRSHQNLQPVDLQPKWCAPVSHFPESHKCCVIAV